MASSSLNFYPVVLLFLGWFVHPPPVAALNVEGEFAAEFLVSGRKLEKTQARGRQIGRGGTGSDPLVERRGIADNPIEGGLEKKAAARRKLERRGSVAF